MAIDCIELSKWQRFPFDGGLFDQPADLMSDVFYLMSISEYQAQMEREQNPESSDNGE